MAAAAETSAGFTQEEVTRWFASLRDLSAWGEANEDRFDSEHFGMKQPNISPMRPPSLEEIEAMRTPFSTAVSAANRAGVAGEISGVLRPHGFSLTDWGALGDRISRAYIALQMSAASDMAGQLNTTISQMENNPHLSVAQKNQIIAAAHAGCGRTGLCERHSLRRIWVCGPTTAGILPRGVGDSLPRPSAYGSNGLLTAAWQC
jgi:hypothetical protein